MWKQKPSIIPQAITTTAVHLSAIVDWNHDKTVQEATTRWSISARPVAAIPNSATNRKCTAAKASSRLCTCAKGLRPACCTPSLAGSLCLRGAHCSLRSCRRTSRWCHANQQWWPPASIHGGLQRDLIRRQWQWRCCWRCGRRNNERRRCACLWWFTAQPALCVTHFRRL